MRVRALTCVMPTKVPNGEAMDNEMPGKSNTEDELQDGPVSAGESLGIYLPSNGITVPDLPS